MNLDSVLPSWEQKHWSFGGPMLESCYGGQKMPGRDSGMSCGLVTEKTGQVVDWMSLA